MGNLCVIPARGGSKRIPRKNIKDFLGKPIIAYSIEAALKSGLFSVVMVSTDDEEIAEIAKKYGAEVPFLRSKKNSDDYTGTGDVVYEVLNEYKKSQIEFQITCCIYATAPFVKHEWLLKSFSDLQNSEADCIMPVSKFPAPIWRSFYMNDNKELTRPFPKYEAYRSQDLEETYYDTGQFYMMYTKQLDKLKNKNVFGLKRIGLEVLGHEQCDIDNPEDWNIAEHKFKLLSGLDSNCDK